MKNEKDYFNDISLLFIGFDGYIDVWNHCFELLNEYWPIRPKTYLACSELYPTYKNIEVINAGKNSEWSKKAQIALEQIKTKYVLLMLEDFFIYDYVDNSQIAEVMQLIKENGIKFYQLSVQLIHQRLIRGKPYKNNKHIHVIRKDKKYPLNLQAAIWDKNYLKKRIGNGNYNAWMFEIKQLNFREYNAEHIDCLIDDRNICRILHTVVQSKYLPGAIKKLNKYGYYINESEREFLNKRENFKYMLKLFMYEITPNFLIRPIKMVGKLMKVDFVTDRINNNR